MKKYRSTGYSTIALTATRSYYNNRTKRTWLHEAPDGSARYTCLGPGEKSGSTSGWQAAAKAVYLTTVTSC
jgi:hypothetical protein